MSVSGNHVSADAFLLELGRTNERIDSTNSKIDTTCAAINELTTTVAQIVGTPHLPGPLVTAIETQKDHEKRIESLERRDWRLIGIAGGLFLVVETIAHLAAITKLFYAPH